MKTKILSKFTLAVLILLSASAIYAQNINVIPNPTASDIFIWDGSGGGALSGYAGTPIILNNSLVLEYNATGVSGNSTTQTTIQLSVYDGSSITVISNPDAGPGIYFQSVQLIFNNELFFIYLDASLKQRLASFNGTTITLYPNPDAGLGYIGAPRIYNGSLYVAYSNAAGVTQYGLFTGSGISLIPNPDNSTVGFYNNYSVVFDNKICSRYVSEDGTKHLATFNGTAWTIYPNPDNTLRGVYPDFPVTYKNKLYWLYFSAANQYQFMQYDGTNNPTLIANPENSGSNGGGVTGFPIVNDDTLFFQYYNTSNIYQLGKFDGTTETLVPNPDNSPYGYWWVPSVYNNDLYILYQTGDTLRHLAQYKKGNNSLQVFPNPDGGLGYWDKPIVYDNKLFLMYSNALSVFQLGYFDGSIIKLISNPSGFYNGASGNNGYTGFPIIWNNLLYMQFGGVPYGNAGNLASFDGSTLPVSWLSFDGVLQNNQAVLNWSTANEINNKGYEIQKSLDGQTFAAIGFVNGHGNSSQINSYNYTDPKVVSGSNYYRLKQIDNDGKYSYSSVIKLDYSQFDWSVSGNPVTNNSWVQLQLDKASTISVKIISINGQIIQTINKGNISSGTYSIPLNFGHASSGMYVVQLLVDGKNYSKKIIK